jgi:hypothetical protein
MPPSSPDRGRPAAAQPPGAGRFVLPIALFVLAGIPAVAYLWDSLNHLFAGQVDGGRLLVGLAALAVLVLLLGMLARTLGRWEAHRSD